MFLLFSFVLVAALCLYNRFVIAPILASVE